ncbi:amidohydrolase family protein [Metallumcola ferriviriculae]|uniref:Amidohydrolase family protein n=1 Tax=Metallumcola ferriviriculae TaxID=3039180 RepID=A0AAU0UPI5_9FIRM|nr:amidohydrolase family protein [Desulfitibacteraceae bacterium MK1]
MIVDFRVRVPLRDTEDDPMVPAPPFMGRYNKLLNYEERVNKPLDKLIEEMDEARINRAVLQAEYEYGDYAKILNRRAGEIVARYPNRFVGFATVDPREGMEAVRELETAVKDFGLRGLNLQPCFLRMEPTHRLFYPLYAKCVELGIPVTLHTGVNYSEVHPMKYDHPLHIDEVACDFPELNIIACHTGWPWISDIVAVARKHPKVYMDLGGISPKYIAKQGSGWEVFFHFANSLLQEQVLFATDWPVFPFQRAIEELKGLAFKEEVKEKILFRNAEKLLEEIS